MKFQEAQILALVIQSKAVEVEVIAMQAADRVAYEEGVYHHTASDYSDKSHQLGTIASEIEGIARQGYLE